MSQLFWVLWAQLSWVFCFIVSYKAVIKLSVGDVISLEDDWGGFTFKLAQVVIGRIHFLAPLNWGLNSLWAFGSLPHGPFHRESPNMVARKRTRETEPVRERWTASLLHVISASTCSFSGLQPSNLLVAFLSFFHTCNFCRVKILESILCVVR